MLIEIVDFEACFFTKKKRKNFMVSHKPMLFSGLMYFNNSNQYDVTRQPTRKHIPNMINFY